MRFLHICHSMKYGGITSFVKSLIETNKSQEAGHDVLIWKISDHQSVLSKNFIDISKSTNKTKDLELVAQKYDKVLFHSVPPFMLKTIYHLRHKSYIFQHGLTFGNKLPGALINALIYLVTIHIFGLKIICSSEYAFIKLKRRLVFVFPKNIIIIPFGINLGNRLVIKAKNKENNNLVLGTASHLIEQKRIGNILNAIELLKHNERITFKIAGTGPLEHDLKQQACLIQNNLISIEFLGEVKNMLDFYDSIDLFILPSKGESFGLVVLEALARNVPVIVYSDSGTCVDFIQPGINGFVVENDKELSSKISELAGNITYNKLIENTLRSDLSKFDIRNTSIDLSLI